MAGRKYNVSRVYIFEDSEDGTWCKNTFEWCNDGIEPVIDSLQHVSYEGLGHNYQENFDENGIFYCRDISSLPKEQYNLLAAQGIRALLQCAIRDGGKFAGFVGFEDVYKRQSSLNMLSRMPVDILKLDMKFLQGEIEQSSNEGIVQFIMSLARHMKLRVCLLYTSRCV